MLQSLPLAWAWHDILVKRQPDPHKSQRPQYHHTWQYSVTEKQQQQNNAPASDSAQHYLRQETAGGDVQGSNRKLCASAQKAMCYSSCNHSSRKWSLPKKVAMLGQLSVALVGGVQGSAPQRQQLYVHKGRYPHFPRARALRKRHRAMAEFLVENKKICEGRKYMYLLEKLCFWDKVMLKRYTLIYKHARPNFWVPCYTNQKIIVTHVINHNEQQSMKV